ncbi:PA14 domain-containing protein [Parafrankia irregularis]|uniref:PA14 domain-containing protein n=1 Tax=Parafrankia irregularis TaxID=795642 RepID=UPI000B80CBC7|nr:PA14 domain-containing protein [Parafrankia irregularis]MBE3203797.1 DUF1929 domain-containing protein [Parafrankia sp. CH37]
MSAADLRRPKRARARRGPARRRRRILVAVLVFALVDLGALLLVAPSANAITCPAGQWAADYYEGTSLTGTPAGSRCDSEIYFTWTDQGPGIGGLGTENFSVRWTQTVTFPAEGTYTFTGVADDGIRVILDGTTVINGWVDQGPTAYTAEPHITAGQHQVVVEYYQHGAGSVVAFDWSGGPPPTASCEPDQWSAAYYAGRTLSGTPTLQCETAVNHDWGAGAPGVGTLGVDNFSVRWIRTDTFEAGPVTFTATADDGIRVWLDNTLVIDEWRDQGTPTFTGTVPAVTAGEHTIKVEYYEAGGGAVARVSYAGAPPPASVCQATQWSASYFAGTALAGNAVAQRCEDAVDHDWGEGTPGLPGIGADNFSARWTRTDTFQAGQVTFNATADDGIRVWLDNTLVIDEWRDQGPEPYSETVDVTAGTHTIKVEYYEKGGGALVRAGYTTTVETGVSACTSIEWSAAYFNNRTLAGAPVAERCEAPLSYDFGETGPGVGGLGGYNFSARWLRTDRFRGGTTTISATADDGVRVWLDNTKVIDEWRAQGPTTFTATVPVTEGVHTVRVEYYQGDGGGLVRASYTGGGAPGPLPAPPPGGCTSNCQGSWTVLPYEAPVRSIHATVLRTGNVLLVAGSGNNQQNFENGVLTSKVWNPNTGAFADVPTADDLFCVGHTQLSDGRILLAGGTRAYPTPTENYYGLDVTYIFDPIAGTYEIVGDMPGGGHWYPSLVNLGNGDVFATGGLNETGSGNVSVEMWDDSAQRWKQLNEVQQTYSYWGLYPNMILMSDGRLFYAGTHTFGNALPGTSGSEIYDLDAGTITEVAGLRDIDFRDQGGTVLLPPAQAQKVMTLGGGNSYSPLDPTAKTDIIDLSAPDPSWTAGPDLAAGKMYVSPVILPDGKVFETGGAKHNYNEYAVHEASMYDPVTNTFTPMPADPLNRMYHSSAFLLPDGRVAAIGNNPSDGSFDLGISVYSPWYMNRARPTISDAPAQFDYGGNYDLTVSGGIGRATLIRPSSVTHSSDPNQRSVDLPITGTGTSISVEMPTNPNLVPPGYYMLFVQDSSGVPSVARWVHVG